MATLSNCDSSTASEILKNVICRIDKCCGERDSVKDLVVAGLQGPKVGKDAKIVDEKSLRSALKWHGAYKDGARYRKTTVTFNKYRPRIEKSDVLYCCAGQRPIIPKGSSWFDCAVDELPEEKHCKIGKQEKTELKQAPVDRDPDLSAPQNENKATKRKDPATPTRPQQARAMDMRAPYPKQGLIRVSVDGGPDLSAA